MPPCKDIDLTNPKLGSELLRDPQGDLPIDVWAKYFWEHSDEYRPVLDWQIDPFDPGFDDDLIDPQQAVDAALLWVRYTIGQLPDSPGEALKTANHALEILMHASSACRRKRGQPASMQHMAVRAYIIRKFNPDPRKPSQSRVGWSRLADILFVNDEKCSRCDLSNHQYDSPCVKALTAEVTRLKAAMNHDGIPF